MPLSHTANLVLYVPYSSEYIVPPEKKIDLNLDTFFRKCFVGPHLLKDMAEIKNLPESEITDPEYPLKREDFLHKYNEDIIQRQTFLDWLNGDGEGIYLFRGDAGTGKTTYLHYLKWSSKNINWKILDLRRASEKINVLGQRVKFRNFYSLHGKVNACFIGKILSQIFIRKTGRNEVGVYDYIKTYERIQTLLKRYETEILPAEPLDEYGMLYRELRAVSIPNDENENIEAYCRECAGVIAKYFMNKCALCEDLSDALECALTHYMIVLKCFSDASEKILIAIDNLERFIGAHEIFSNELIKFIRNLRRIVDSFKEEFFIQAENRNAFAEHFQIVIAMRNTSARGFTPKQNLDFFEGSIDLSEWFSMGEIIEKKLRWYKTKGYHIEIGEKLQYIMKDFGIAKEGIVRGLRPKLNMIFNYNKRLAIEFLVEVLESPSNKDMLDTADKIRLETFGESTTDGGLSSFAYRSIIWRLLMDKLNRGGMFRYIFSRKNSAMDSDIDLDYIRNILTILSNYSLENNEQYMPLENVVGILHHINGDPTVWFDNRIWAVEREKVAQLLYYMNYYNRRENNWFQFIDIQCNDASYDKFHCEKWEDILALIETRNKKGRRIGIRITSAGKAYIGYIVQAFEFLSCIEGNTMPLLCCLPTEEELIKTEIDSLRCIRIIENVWNRVQHYLDNDDYRIQYKYPHRAFGYSYTNRIINSHIGYLDNFCRCVEKVITSPEEHLTAKKNALIERIKNITDLYRRLAVEDSQYRT